MNNSVNKEFKISSDGVLETVIVNSNDVYVPEGVKSIAKTAFANCKARKVYLPNSVTNIESGAFKESHIEFIKLSTSMNESSTSG